MRYTKKETDQWKASMRGRAGFKFPKKTKDQLPGMISVIDPATGTVTLVKPVFKKIKFKVRKNKKKVRSSKPVKIGA
jgi:hypothetical protein